MPARRSHPINALPRWATRGVTAEYLHVSERTLDTWIADGRIPAYRTPGKRTLLFDLNDVDEAIRRGRVIKAAS